MKWPRLTTRRIIGIVFVSALALGLGLPAWEVGRDRECHVHAWIDKLDPQHPIPTVESSSHVWLRKALKQEPARITKVTYIFGLDPVRIAFWPRYWRCLRGLPWKMQKGCHPEGTQIELACELEHPEMCYRPKPATGRGLIFTMSPPSSIQTNFNRLQDASRDR